MNSYDISAATAACMENPRPPDLLGQLLNDHGNSLRLIVMYGDDLRYCHAMKKWLLWDGRRWALDKTDQARKLAKQAMLEFLRQAIDARNEPAEKFARASLDAKRISNLLSMSECENYVQPEQLDTHPYLLNFINGTVDLRTTELKPHRRDDFITRLVNHRFNPAAECPRWNAFLFEIMGGHPDAGEAQNERAARMADYLQRALGYSLTGTTNEKAVFVVFGEGDNGKSTMLTTFRQLIDDYAALIQVDTLMVRQESNNTQADKADLRGARFVQTSETEEGQRLAQGKLKAITQGMGMIKAARKYENHITFTETHKLWMDTNRKPTIDDADDKATFSRLHPIPFTVNVASERIDRDLPNKLLRESEGILAWAVAGAKLWHQAGLQRPPEVDEVRAEWQAEMDQVTRFIQDRCVVADSVRCGTSALYTDYQRWVETAGEKKTMPRKKFKEKLLKRRHAERHTNHGDFYSGIGLRSDEPDANR